MRSNIFASGLAIVLGVGSGSMVLPEVAIAQSTISNQPAQSLLTQAKRHFRQAEFKKAIGIYQQILALPNLDTSAKIDALTSWAEIDLGTNQTSQAEEKLQQALKLSQESRDRSREGEILAALGWAARNRQDYPKAQERLNQSLTIATQVGNKKGEARSILLLGTVQYVQGDYPKAFATCQSALKVAQAVDNQDEVAHIYDWMAAIAREQKEFKSAEDLIEKQISLSRTIGYRVAEIDGLFNKAILKSRQEKPDQAIQLYQQALDIAQPADNPWTYLVIARELAWTYVTQKETDKAVNVYQKALVVARTIDEPAVADIMNRIGVAYTRSAQYPQALEAYQQALTIYLKTNQKTDTAQVLSNLGYIYKEQKLHVESRKYYQQALALYETLGNQVKQSETLSEIGYSYLSESDTILKKKPDYPQATALAQQGTLVLQKQLAIARKINDRSQIFWALMGIGQGYGRQSTVADIAGQYTEALPLEQQGLAFRQEGLKIAEELKDSDRIKLAQSEVESSYFGLVINYTDLQKFDAALEYLEKVRKIVQIQKKPESEKRLLDRELLIYISLNNTYTNPKQYSEKLKVQQRIIDLSKQLDKPNTEIVYLNLNAQIYYFWGQYDRAEEFYNQSLSLAQSIKNHQMESLALLGQGLIFDARADYPNALARNQEALKIIRTHNFKDIEIPALNNISNIHKLTGQYSEALIYNQEARNLIQSQSDIYTKGVTIESIRAVCFDSDNFRGKSKPQESQSSLSRACNEPIAIPTGYILDLLKGSIDSSAQRNRSSFMTNFNNLGSIYHDRGDYLKAIEFYKKSLEISREIKDTKIESLVLNNLATVYSDQGNYNLALPLSEQALAMSIEQKNPSNEMIFRSNFANIYSVRGNYPKALEAYQQILTLAEKLKTPLTKSIALRAIGKIYNYQGNYTQAIDSLQQSLKIEQESGSPTGIIMAEEFLSKIYIKLGQTQKALDLGQKALALSQKIGAGSYEISSLQNLAEIHVDRGDIKSAQENFQKALDLANRSGAIESKSLILFGMANIKLSQNQPQQALDILQETLKLQQAMGTKRATAQTLNRIGQAQIQLNSPEASTSLQSAIVLTQEIGDVPTQASTLANLANLATKQNQSPLAIVLYKQSVIQYEIVRKGLAPLPKDQQESYAKTVSQTYRNLADLLIQNDRLLEAQQILDLLKLQEIKDYSPATRNALQDNEVKLTETEQKIAKKYGNLVAFRQKLDQCQGKINNAECETLDRDRDQ